MSSVSATPWSVKPYHTEDMNMHIMSGVHMLTLAVAHSIYMVHHAFSSIMRVGVYILALAVVTVYTVRGLPPATIKHSICIYMVVVANPMPCCAA